MFILLSITSIFSFMFIILLVATATLDGLPPYRTVLNCFYLLWTIVLIYFKLFSYILGWFYRLIIVLTFKLFTFKLLTLFSLQYFCASSYLLSSYLHILCFRLFPSSVRPLPPFMVYIYIYIYLCVCVYVYIIINIKVYHKTLP